MGRGNFEGEGVAHCKVQGQSAVICANNGQTNRDTVGMLSDVDPRNHVLDDGTYPP